MDMDDFMAAKPDDLLTRLVRQDLDPLSIEELDSRIAALAAEIDRCRAHIERASRHRHSAEALFKR